MATQVYALTLNPVGLAKKNAKKGKIAIMPGVEFKSLVSADDSNPPKIGAIIKHKLSGVEMMVATVAVLPQGIMVKQSKGIDNDGEGK